MTIQDIVSFVRIAYRVEQFDSVEEVLVSRENKLKAEIQQLQEKFEMERQARGDLLKEVLADKETIAALKKKNSDLELKVCELAKLKEKWVDDSIALAQVRIRVDVLEDLKNAFEVKNRELEISMKKIGKILADVGIRDDEKETRIDTVEPHEDEPPRKRSKLITK